MKNEKLVTNKTFDYSKTENAVYLLFFFVEQKPKSLNYVGLSLLLLVYNYVSSAKKRKNCLQLKRSMINEIKDIGKKRLSNKIHCSSEMEWL